MVTSSHPMNNTSCSSASMIDSFCHTTPTIWDHNPVNSQHLGAVCDMNLQINPTTSSSSLRFRKGNLLGPAETSTSSWAPPNSAIKRSGSIFLSSPDSTSTMLPYTLPQFLAGFSLKGQP
ncbi:hypothetical protein L2E82_03518 [Cichorium intybus]|uniref:Uncharacterized protein n=1 Tax=Cichorium intybus TaxID=13427 RepID=A0ACB9H3P0_CICIN|nr:hypothetical protein L2E82_03518 [Cichorium intybus]